MWTYKQSEPGLYTVGFYDPSGAFNPESDFDSTEKAAERVAYLNGGGRKDTGSAELIAKNLREELVGFKASIEEKVNFFDKQNFDGQIEFLRKELLVLKKNAVTAFLPPGNKIEEVIDEPENDVSLRTAQRLKVVLNDLIENQVRIKSLVKEAEDLWKRDYEIEGYIRNMIETLSGGSVT